MFEYQQNLECKLSYLVEHKCSVCGKSHWTLRMVNVKRERRVKSDS